MQNNALDRNKAGELCGKGLSNNFNVFILGRSGASQSKYIWTNEDRVAQPVRMAAHFKVWNL